MVCSVQSSSLNGSLTLAERYALDETSIFSPVTALASTLTDQVPKHTAVSVSHAGNTARLDFLHRIFLKHSMTPRTWDLRMQPMTSLLPCHKHGEVKMILHVINIRDYHCTTDEEFREMHSLRPSHKWDLYHLKLRFLRSFHSMLINLFI